MVPNIFLAGVRRLQCNQVNRALTGIFNRYQWLSFPPADDTQPTPPPHIQAIWQASETLQPVFKSVLVNQPATNSRHVFGAAVAAQPALASDQPPEALSNDQPSNKDSGPLAEVNSSHSPEPTAKAKPVYGDSSGTNDPYASDAQPAATAVAIEDKSGVVKDGYFSPAAEEEHHIATVVAPKPAITAVNSGNTLHVQSTTESAGTTQSVLTGVALNTSNQHITHPSEVSVPKQLISQSGVATCTQPIQHGKQKVLEQAQPAFGDQAKSPGVYASVPIMPTLSGDSGVLNGPGLLDWQEYPQQAVPGVARETQFEGSGAESGACGKKPKRAEVKSGNQKMRKLSDKQLTSHIIHKLYEPTDKAIRNMALHSPRRISLVEKFIHNTAPFLTAPEYADRRNTIHVATVLTRLAYLVRDARLPVAVDTLAGIRELESTLERVFPSLPASSDAQSLTNILWASAKLDLAVSHGFLSWALDMLERLGLANVQPQGLANVLWSLARHKSEYFTPSKRLLDELAMEVGARAWDLGPQDISNIVWAFATMGVSFYQPSQEVLNNLAAAAIPKLDGFTTQGVGIMLWGYARLESYPADGALFDAALSYMDRNMSKVPPQELVNSLWAVAHMHHPRVSPGLLAKAEQRAAKLLGSFSFLPLQVAALMTSFSNMQYSPCSAEFVGALESYLQHGMARHHAQELSNVMSALGHLQVPVCDETLAAMCHRQKQLMALGEPRVQNVLNFMYGLAMLRDVSEKDFWDVERYICTAGGWPSRELMEFELHQLYCIARLTGYSRHGYSSFANLSEPLRNTSPLVEAAWEAWTTRPLSRHCTSLDADVAAVLRRLDLDHSQKLVTPEGMLVDFALFPHQGGKMAIEVCGPKEYACNVGSHKGDRVLKQRILELDGWTVVSIPFYIWNRLDDVSKEVYVMELLKPLVEPCLEMYG